MGLSYPESADAEDRAVTGVPDGAAGGLGVPESEGAEVVGGAGGADGVPGVAVVGGTVAGTESGVAVPVGVAVAVPGGGAAVVLLGEGSDVGDGAGLGEAGLTAGRGRGACGLFSTRSCGIR
ncbi:hypothetical protein ACFY0F_15530 [Streptomyces sp. NPDC001544]|uniref:hypothetical protein n=1 Tax=Streptomyces sp. NPDC001544 TaxID=3364584 RepID=UPI00369B2296